MRSKIYGLILFICWVGVCHSWAGGLREESPDDPLIQGVINFAFQSLESGTNNALARKIIKVKSVKSQLVAGKQYTITLQLGNTNCSSSSVASGDIHLDSCPFNDDNHIQECSLKVWVKPWEDFRQVTDVNCEQNDKEELDQASTHRFNQLLSSPKSVRQLHKLQSKSHFKKFIKKYDIKYENQGEYDYRFNVFKENMKKVQFLRETERGTAHYGASIFAHLTEDEFKTQKLGFKPKLKDPEIHWPPAKIPDIPLPKSFDWRDKGAVTPVKNQGSCGSCWAFSVTGNLEGLWYQKTKKQISLSEQELVDCDKLDNGCNGGLPDNAYKTIIDLGGLEMEEDYSYDGVDEKCHIDQDKPKFSIDKAVDISKNETQMAQWLISNGPISIGLNANAMQFYMGGVSHPFKFLCSPQNIDHGVLIVGYGIHTYPLFNRKMPYWIIKNSWGPAWGEQGYYRVYRGDGTCGVNQMASSAVFN